MAPRPDTTTGTITLTAGQTAFTTTGVNMLTRGHLPGDEIRRNGLVLTIGAITGENTGTLEDPCPAGAAGTGPTRIRFQADGSRVAAQSRNLVDLIGNGTLQSEAEIDGTGGDWLSYFTGPFTKARTKFTEFARQLLATTDASSARALIEAIGTPEFGLRIAQAPQRSPIATGDFFAVAYWNGNAWEFRKLDYTTLRDVLTGYVNSLNLAGLPSPSAARTNLSVLSTADVQYLDSLRLAKDQNLADLPNKITARTNLGVAREKIATLYGNGATMISQQLLAEFRSVFLRGTLNPTAPAPLELTLLVAGAWQNPTQGYRRRGSAVVGSNAPINQSADAIYYYLNTAENIFNGEVIQFETEIISNSGGRANMFTRSQHTGSSTGVRIFSTTSCDTLFIGDVQGVRLSMGGTGMIGRVDIEGIRA